jgi:uncharacterized protein YciW
MPLAAFARLLGVSPKWVLNTMRALALTPPYTLSLAQRLAVTRAVHESTGMPLLAAYPMARRALEGWNGEEACVILPLTDDISLTIDVYRLLVSLNARLAEVRESYAPMVRGRPQVKRTNALDAATAWGLDLTLLRDNVARTPYERLQQLDAMLAFARNVQRGSIAKRRPDV